MLKHYLYKSVISLQSAMENRFAALQIHVCHFILCELQRRTNHVCAILVAELCHQFTQCLVERDMPSKGIAPLAKAIRKARMNEMQLTSIHGSLLQLCLIAKNLKPALEFLNVDVTEISTEVYRCRFIILKCLV